jgi:hypothetical protein
MEVQVLFELPAFIVVSDQFSVISSQNRSFRASRIWRGELGWALSYTEQG